MSEAAAIAEYVQWLKANGATFDAINWPCETPRTGRGALLTKSLKAGEPFLSVPAKLILNAPRCRSSESGSSSIGAFLSAHPIFTANDEITLAVFLVHERLTGRESFWWPYIATLPLDTNNLGRTWTKQELAELQDDQFVDEVSVMIPRERKEQYAQVAKLLLSSQNLAPAVLTRETVTLDLFSWAMEIVLSRVFGRRIEHMSLVPLADNLNHGNVPVKYSISQEDGRFRLFPTVDITLPSSGADVMVEAFNSYGRRSNANLLMGYGFAIPDNEWDDVQLELQLPPLASPDKKRLFDNPGPFIAQFRVGSVPHAFLRFFRLVYATKHDLQGGTASFSQGGFQFVSRENERAVLRTCKSELEGLLTLFPTTEEEDEEILAQQPQRIKLVFAVLYRLGRKRALFFNLQYLTRMAAWMDAAASTITEESYAAASERILAQLKQASCPGPSL